MISIMIQARMSSTRLPGKVLRPILKRPMLDLLIERVKKSKNFDNIIIVTSVNKADDEIVEYCKKKNLLFYRGDEKYVLKRYYDAAIKYKTSVIVRLTGDCPLIHSKIIDEGIDIFKKNKYDFVSNTVPLPTSFPDGMDVEIFDFNALERAYREAKLPSEKEHVTFYFWKTNKFNCYKFSLEKDYSDFRLTVDYPEDLIVIENIFKSLYNINNNFSLDDIVNFLNDNSELIKLQKNIKRNAGWEQSFKDDSEFIS